MIPDIKENIVQSVWGVNEKSTDKIVDTASASFSVDSEELNVIVDDNHIDEVSYLNELIQEKMSTVRVSTL